jgi:uncharacterized Zn-binding protein involved in type VI secretion
MSIMPVARKGDRTVGVCPIHGAQGGRIITGKVNTKVNGSIITTIGDTVLANCGHTGRIITGNFLEIDTNMPVARLGDRFVGVYSGVIIQGSPNTRS